MTWNERSGALIAVLVALAPAGAGAEPKHGHRHGQQAIPTGEEDSPAGKAKAETARARAAQAELERMTSRSTEGLTPVVRGDGTVVLDLEGRFQSIVRADGACVTSAADAAAPAAGTKTAPVLEEK